MWPKVTSSVSVNQPSNCNAGSGPQGVLTNEWLLLEGMNGTGRSMLGREARLKTRATSFHPPQASARDMREQKRESISRSAPCWIALSLASQKDSFEASQAALNHAFWKKKVSYLVNFITDVFHPIKMTSLSYWRGERESERAHTCTPKVLEEKLRGFWWHYWGALDFFFIENYFETFSQCYNYD